MSAELAELDTLRELATKLATAGHGQKGELVSRVAKLLNYSVQEVYRRLERAGFDSGRKPRADKGRTKVSETLARKVGGMVHVATRANSKKTLAIKTALTILTEDGRHGEANPETGEIMQIEVSASTVSRAMRRYRCHPEQLSVPTPHVSQRSLHPNHVWQIDASVCVLFYLPKGGLSVMEEKEFYKNKPQNIKKVENERVIRYVITDHYSGWIFLWYVHGSEDTANLIEAFLAAIQYRGATDPMHGVPLILMMDKGSANVSGLFLNLLKNLHVEAIVHGVGNPRAKGQVENGQNLVETQFEGRLPFLRINSLAELQAAADRWRIAYNATAKHSRYGKPRNAMWLTIREDQLRIAPPLALLRELVNTQPMPATVRGNLTISHSTKGYGSQDYDLRHIPGIHPKEKVQVIVNAYRAPAIDVVITDLGGVEATYTVEPMQVDLAGFPATAPIIGASYAAQAKDATERSREAIRQSAYGVSTEREVDAQRKQRVTAYEGQINAMADVDSVSVPTYLPKRGRDLAVESRERNIQPLNHIEAAKRIRQAMGEAWTKGHFQWLTQRHPDGVAEDQIEAIVAELSGPKAQHKTPLRLAVGGE
jgi:transposase InsO family protein